MPQNKLQHYVPRCHLRPFTLDGKGKAVDLYHISGARIIQGAEAQSQCAKPYFYGADLVIEKALQGPEGIYAAAVRHLAEGGVPDQRHLGNLLDYFALQHFRSFGQMERLTLMGRQMNEDIQKLRLGEAPAFLTEWQVSIRFLLKVAAELMQDGHLDDLRVAIGKAPPASTFVTSDDPAIHCNRFHTQRLREDTFGFGSTGAMMIMPLTPGLVFMAFDPYCYTAMPRGPFIDLTRQDVRSLNQLQMLHARSAIYLPPETDIDGFLSDFAEIAPSRPAAWSRIRYLLQDGESASYTQVPAMPTSGTFLQQVEQIRPAPKNWPKTIAFRTRISMRKTGTAVGILRPTYNLPAIRKKQERRAKRTPEGSAG